MQGGGAYGYKEGRVMLTLLGGEAVFGSLDDVDD